MAITSWTSEGMNWGAPVPSESKYTEAIRLATIERCKIFGWDHSTIDFPLYENSPKGILIDQGLLYNIQSLIRSFISNFVNHTINGGDFSGEASIPDWTKNTIFKEIGDNEAPLPQDSMLPSYDWVLQQYNLLNLFRWIQVTDGSASPWQSAGGYGLTWADAETAYLADQWHPWTTYTGDLVFYWGRYLGIPPNNFWKYMELRTYSKTGLYDDDKDWDFYVKPTSYYLIAGTFEPLQGTSVNVYNLIDTGAAHSGTTFNWSPTDTIADGGQASPQGATNSQTICRYEFDSLVLKYDLDFKNW